jgi:hypothetical protein
MRHSKWFWYRIVLTVSGGLQGVWFTSPESVESSNVGWMDCLLVFAFAALGLQAVIGVQAINPRSAKTWRKPSWEINPFLLQEPLQFFHFAAYSCLAAGIVACFTLLYGDPAAASLAVMLLSAGAGLRLGVQLSLYVFRNKTAQRTETANAETLSLNLKDPAKHGTDS